MRQFLLIQILNFVICLVLVQRTVLYFVEEVLLGMVFYSMTARSNLVCYLRLIVKDTLFKFRSIIDTSVL